MSQTSQEHSSHLKALKESLVGDGDTTLLTQLKLLRQESKDGTNEIRDSLDQFAATLAENNSKAFIEALEGAVREFNEKISEQFGENFKRLNEAVGQLLEWQAQYRIQLTEMMQAFREIETRFQELSSNVGQVATQTEALGKVSEQQAQWLEAQLSAQTELEARLAAFAEMAQQAQSALPLVNQNLEEIAQGVKRTVRDTLVSLEEVTESLQSGVSDSQQQITTLTERLSNEIQTSVATFQQQSLEAHSRHQQRLEESVQELDRMLGEELSKSLESLGNQLATLSSRFVEDYQPLTESLREVVQLSRRLRS
jgi:DNA repair exonuclease SbcCD ATPase subunit